MSRKRIKILVVGLALLLTAATLVGVYGRSMWVPVAKRILGRQTVASVVDRYGDAARAQMTPRFESSGVAYPPTRVLLLASKEDAWLELWAAEKSDSDYRLVHRYPIQKLSGELGPKLREGDRQVPEGVYAIEGLNPNSSYHLSMKLNYPNAFDRERAAEDGRLNPGSNIFIHGKAQSVGCLAMGDPTIEELFVLAADVGIENVRVVIAPRDPHPPGWDTPPSGSPAWTPTLYEYIAAELAALPPTK